MEEELKLAQQFSERLKLDVSKLKYFFEVPEEVIENEFPGNVFFIETSVTILKLNVLNVLRT